MDVEERVEAREDRDQELDGFSEEKAGVDSGALLVGGEQAGRRKSDEDQANHESNGPDKEAFPHSGLLKKYGLPWEMIGGTD